MSLKNRNLISITDYSISEYIEILKIAAEFEINTNQKLLENHVVATLFFEPSTRTRLSFESAVSRLGGKILGFSNAETTSITKGETLNDTIKTIGNYCDLIVIRHPLDGSARFASEVSSVPVINAGDGSNQHPTQTLLDMYSIQKTQGRFDDLNICFVGDLKYGRTVHSLAQALSGFKCNFNFVSPEELRIPDEIKLSLDKSGSSYMETEDLENIIPDIDILYVTRVQRERFSDQLEYERVKSVYVLKESMLQNSKENLKVLHPLPRVNEISSDVDKTKNAYYFEQALNGTYIRQAIVSMILGVK